jgi:hypothetical protein
MVVAHAAGSSPPLGMRLGYLVHTGVISRTRGVETTGLALLFCLIHHRDIAPKRGNYASTGT